MKFTYLPMWGPEPEQQHRRIKQSPTVYDNRSSTHYNPLFFVLNGNSVLLTMY
jgi:hypothetical protein